MYKTLHVMRDLKALEKFQKSQELNFRFSNVGIWDPTHLP